MVSSNYLRGGDVLFFRVVHAKYKKREYQYLKLLESRREGGKVKHLQLVNLSGAVQLGEYRMKLLFEDLNKTLTLYRELSDSGPHWCKYLKASYIMALENSFNVEQRCRDLDFRELLVQDGKRKQSIHLDENIFFDIVYRESLEQGVSRGFIVWLEKRHLFIFDCSGFPLKILPLRELREKEIARFLTELKIEKLLPEFFLGKSCELLYNTFRLMATGAGDKSFATKEIFVYKQLPDWSGKPASTMEKALICGVHPLNDERISEALMLVNCFKNHIDYIDRRIAALTGETFMPDQDPDYTYFMSSFFKKIFDNVRKKHNI